MSEMGPTYQITPPPQTVDRGAEALVKQYHIVRNLGKAATLTAVFIDGVMFLFADGRQVGRIVLCGR